MCDGMQIEHDQDEPPRDRTGNWPYWLGILVVAALWVATLASHTLDWNSVGLGAITGGVFVIVMAAYTGNKVPKWMR